MRSSSLVLLTVAALLLPSVANAECHLAKYLELPVTMRGERPIVSAQIDGKDAQFILDSGAFFSTLSPASAQTYGLRLSALPAGFELKGINGTASGWLTTVRTFGLAGVTLPNIQFLVGGTDVGQAGVLGQNFLGLGDVEYDFRHGAVRLLRAKGCKVEELSYWASDYPVTIIPLEQRTPHQRHTIGTVTLNGVKLRAVFDTGAPSSVLTLSAARKAGLTPNSPGVVPGGISFGFGTRTLRTWIGTFNRLEIGGEAIPSPRIRFSEAELNDADMLIGADFFLTHRVYVANDAAKMLFTYEGGPVFGITPTGANDDKGKALDLTDRTATPTDAEGFSRRGAAFASSGNLQAAIADFDRAIALAPNQARYLRQRAAARMANRQPLLAAGDLDKALAIDPGDIDSRLMRARMRLAARDPDGAGEDIRLIDKELSPSAGERLQLASMAEGAGLLELALANQDAWLKAHPEDALRPSALNGQCWSLAQLNRDLKKALDDCNAALRARPNTAAYLDSRGLVRLRLGDLRGALADYNAALSAQPGSAWTLYMRGLVKLKTGDATGGEADRRAALAIAPRVADRAVKLGLDK
jgi:predicted aspartyl protease/tetratricopeptide (TPR) repeat protein